MNIRRFLNTGGTIVGSWISTVSPIAAEIMARSGFDFLVADGEHAPATVGDIHTLCLAVRAGNPRCRPMVRVPDTRYDVVKRYMDAGATGVIAPMVTSPEQAREVVDAVKYPPQGTRGVGFAPGNAYGMELLEHLENEHEHSLVVVQIEHVDALERLDDILAVPGIDAAMVGPYDLSASMSIPGEFEHPKMVAALEHIFQACVASNIAPGVHVVQPDPHEARMRMEQGYRFLTYSLDVAMLAHCCTRGLKELKPARPRSEKGQ